MGAQFWRRLRPGDLPGDRFHQAADKRRCFFV